MQQSENAFFRLLWRFNAFAIAIAASMCILLGLVVAAILFREEARLGRPSNFVAVGQQDKVSEEFSLGRPGTASGTAVVRLPLFRGQSSYGPGSLPSLKGSGRQSTVNYLFLDTSTNDIRWLFDGVGQLIVDDHVLFDKAKEFRDQPRMAVGIVYSVVEKDSNGDGRLTERDAVSLTTSATDGTGYRKLLEGIDQILSVQQTADDKVLVLYQKNGQTFSELYSVPSMARLAQTSIPKVNLN